MEQPQNKNKKTEKDKEKFEKALNTYYKLKQKYEDKYYEQKKKIMRKEDKSWKEKRREFSRLNPACINCNRPVKTNFYVTVDDVKNRTLHALCGDSKDPCSLKIEINVGHTIGVDEEIKESKQKINEGKKQIIMDKNNLIFDYISTDEAVNNFDKIKEEIHEYTNMYESQVSVYNSVAENEDRHRELTELVGGFNESIKVLKESVQAYEKDPNNVDSIVLVKDGVEGVFYKEDNKFISKAQPIREKKYYYTGMDFDKKDNIFKLVQVPFEYSPELLEQNVGENGETVISMQVGVDLQNKKNKKLATIPMTPLKKYRFKRDLDEVLDEALDSDADADGESDAGLEFETLSESEKTEDEDDEGEGGDDESEKTEDEDADESEELRSVD